jgi:hypothetical protein
MQRCRAAGQRELDLFYHGCHQSESESECCQTAQRSTIQHRPRLPGRFGFGSPGGLGRGYAVSHSRLDHVYFQPQWSVGPSTGPIWMGSGWVALDAGWRQKAQGKVGSEGGW